MKYKDYLNSSHWKELRIKRYKMRDKCRICESLDMLNLHHKTYKNLGNEKHADLVVLCRDCHYLWHQLYRFKKLNTRNIDRIKNLMKINFSKEKAFANCIGNSYKLLWENHNPTKPAGPSGSGHIPL